LDERFDLAGASGQGYDIVGGSLADAFLKNKGKLREKLDQRVLEEEPNVEKKVRKYLDAPIDKVRLAQLRKEMRKKPHLANLNVDRDTATEYSAPAHGYSNNNLKALTNNGPRTPKSMGLTSVMGSTSNLTAKEPNPELLSRLCMGGKAKVDKKDMLALTRKNYNLLPEIQKKRTEVNKTETFKERARKVKEMDMVSFSEPKIFPRKEESSY
jgi:hypothetical protein